MIEILLPHLRQFKSGAKRRAPKMRNCERLPMITFRHLLPALALFASSVLLAAGDPVTVESGPRPAALSRPETTEKAIDAGGFIKRWLILEPIPVSGRLTDSAVQATVKKEYFTNQLSVLPRDGDKARVGDVELKWHAVDTKEYNVNLYHFAHALGRPTSDVLFWAVTTINCPEEIPGVRLAIGSNAASVWWVNGQEVIGIYGDRQTVVDDGVSKRLTLRKGTNVVRCAVINAGGATDFCARFLDPADKPLKGLRISGP